MDSPSCPNCGGTMALLRRERQHSHRSTIDLVWSVCIACRHVRLESWRMLPQHLNEQPEAEQRRRR